MPKKKIDSFRLNKSDLPKVRDPFHRTLSAKAGASGRLQSEDEYYRRHQAKEDGEREIAEQLDSSNEEERNFLLQEIIAQIEQWAGEDGLELGEKIKKAEPTEKAKWYLAALKDELSDEYYQQDDQIARQQKEMIEQWISQLEQLIS